MRQLEHHEHVPHRHHGRELAVGLVDLGDALNVGQAFRVCAGLGVRHLYLIGQTATPPSARLNRTARGAQYEVPFSTLSTAGFLAAWTRARGDGGAVGAGPATGAWTLVGIEYATASREIGAVVAQHRNQPAVLLVGNEARGLSREVLAACDAVAHLPLHGRVSSYNVATALALAVWSFLGAGAAPGGAPGGDPTASG